MPRRYEKHGLYHTPEYRIWRAMLQRCHNPNYKAYENYGARGVTVCEKWRESMLAFYTDVGPRPDSTAQLDRIDNNGNYEPGNVRWTTAAINSQNQRRGKVWVVHGVWYNSLREAGKANNVSGVTILQWCEGWVRKNRNNEYYPPRPGCYSEKKYA